jgi:hypothetical protein
MLTASHPIFSAFTLCRTEVHLWMTWIPAFLNAGRKGSGLRPAVSTIFTPDSTIACAYSWCATGRIVGRIVRLIPKGLSVNSRVRRTSSMSSSAVGWVSAVRNPSAPALATAATSPARPTPIIPPITTGCSIPNSSVNLVLIMSSPPPGALRIASRVRNSVRQTELQGLKDLALR